MNDALILFLMGFFWPAHDRHTYAHMPALIFLRSFVYLSCFLTQKLDRQQHS
jgi:hypothetical protein